MMVRQPRRALFGIVYKLLPLAYNSVSLICTSSEAYTGKGTYKLHRNPGWDYGANCKFTAKLP